MTTVAIEADLYRRIEKAADAKRASVDALLSEVIQRYLWDLERRAIAEQSAVYRRLHPSLRAEYPDRYIAMHDGEVVDHDVDLPALLGRVRQQWRDTPVLVTWVGDSAEVIVSRRGFVMDAAQ